MVKEKDLQPINILKSETLILKIYNKDKETQPELFANLIETLDRIIKEHH